MSHQYINIYASARNASGLTQERAAEAIGISVESIRAYEGDVRIPTDETVVRMADVYGAKHLAYQHLRSKSPLARMYMPELTMKDVAASILKLQKEVNDFTKCKDELIEIGSDNVITEDERPRWERILKELDDISQAILSLKVVNIEPQL